MSSRDYKFGDVVEWDIYEGRVIRWFIIHGTPGAYQAIHVATSGVGKKWEYEDGRVVPIGVGGTDSRANERLLNE